MKLPNGAAAIVSIDKLSGYCLDPTHRVGRHKAMVFAAALGLGLAEADMLRDQLLAAASAGDAIETKRTAYGVYFEIVFTCAGTTGVADVLSVWEIASDQSPPRLITCYVL